MTPIIQLVRNRFGLLAWGTAILAATATLAIERKGDNPATPPAPKGVKLTVDDRPVDRTGRLGTSFAPVVKKVAPSVVQVFTSTKARTTWQSDRGDMDELRRFFFGPGRGGPRMQPGLTPRQEGIGSGVVVTEDGTILTNNHVVDGADTVKVKFQDGREFTAKVVGKDPKTDVAVLKVEAKDLPYLELADSDQIEVGDIVLAIGNPFGIGQTVTMGMVSATGRGNMGLDYEDFIQTDAAINPGNSGGALVDSEGRLVGINTAIISRSGGNQGIGFAIPTNLAKNVLESLVRDGRVTRGYLGVLIQDVTPTLAKEFKLENQRGVIIGDVTPRGPAEKAGLESGDVVLEFDGKPVNDSRHLKLQVAQTKPNTTVPLTILRNGSRKTIEVTLKELPESRQMARNSETPTPDTGKLNGVAVDDLDSRTRRQLDAPANLRGALVTQVEPGSPAYEAGLRSGDVIVEIDRHAVRSAEDAVRLTEDAKDKSTLLRVWRDGSNRYVVVDESEAG